MKLLALALILKLGFMTDIVQSETIEMGTEKNQFVGIDIGATHIRVSHNGNEYHNGVMIAAGTGRKTSLMFRASQLAEHPNFILPRFAGDLSRLKSFSIVPIQKQRILRAQLAMQTKPERVVSITLGPVLEDDLRRLIVALEPHGIQVFQE